MALFWTRFLWYAHASLPGAVLAAALFLAVYPLRRHRLKRMGLRSGGQREAILLLFWIYCACMALLTLTPRGFDLLSALRGAWSGPFFQMGTVSLEPLRTLRYSHLVFWGNLLLFLPFGLFPAVLWRNARWYRALLIACGVTLGIECWQLLVGRTFDVDDLLLNALGGMLGWVLWLILRRPDLYCEEV
jgi:glycopeptide antibiotics resistance protein